MDFGKYGEFLETVIKDILETQPENIAVVFFSGDGEAHTHYFGNCYPAEVGQMAWQLNADAFLTMAQANAQTILEAAEEEEEEREVLSVRLVDANLHDYCPNCGAKMDGGDTP